MTHTHSLHTRRAARTAGPRAFQISRGQHEPVDYEQDMRDAGLVEGNDGIWYLPVGLGV